MELNEIVSKLRCHADLVSAGIDSDSALRATFGEDVYRETQKIEKQIEALHKINSAMESINQTIADIWKR